MDVTPVGTENVYEPELHETAPHGVTSLPGALFLKEIHSFSVLYGTNMPRPFRLFIQSQYDQGVIRLEAVAPTESDWAETLFPNSKEKEKSINTITLKVFVHVIIFSLILLYLLSDCQFLSAEPVENYASR